MEDDPTKKFSNISERLKAELNLAESDIYKDIPPVETELTLGSYPYWCWSQAARFVWSKVEERQMHLQNDRLDIDEECPFFLAMMYGMSQHELEMFAKMVPDGKLKWHAERVFRRLYSKEQKESWRNETIDDLIAKFCNGNSDERHDTRCQLWNRFGAQSHFDQAKIVKALLKGEDWDREWCYETMKTWWGDELIPDVQRAWETFHEKECAGIVARKLPSSYVVSHRNELEEKDYASVCLRLCTDNDSPVDDTRLNRAEFVEIAVHNHWEIDDNEADELLFGYLLDVLNGRVSHVINAYKFETTFSHHDYTRQSERLNYRPTLLFIEAVEDYIVALGKLGKTNTIIKFYRWNKHARQLLEDYLSDFAVTNKIHERMNDDFAVYQRWVWKNFTSFALQSFPFDAKEFWNTHNKYRFLDHDMSYYSGRDWREDVFTGMYYKAAAGC